MSQFDGLSLSELEQWVADAATKADRLASQRNTLELQIKPFQEAMEETASELRATRNLLASIKAELERRRAPRAEPTVTDHALLRYIERVHGIDMDKLRDVILSQTVRMAVERGATTVRSDGLIYRLKNNAVVTVGLAKKDADPRKTNRLTRAQRERLEEGDDYAEAC